MQSGKMNRRTFGQTVAGAALGAALSPLASAGNMEMGAALPLKLSIMLWTIYRDEPFEKRLEKVAEAGYRAVELVNEFEKWTEDDFRRANAKKRELGITFDSTAGVWKGIADPAGQDAFLAGMKKFLPVVEKLECSSLIVLSGNRIEGASREAQHNACVEVLKRAADLAEKQNISLYLENIDPEENPKYFLTSVAEGFEIVRKVDHPRVKFLYDFFHEQISEGNLIAKLEKNIDWVGLVHVADVPGRHKPGTGEINYANIYRKLAQLNYKGYVAMEFMPTGNPVADLKEARAMVENAIRKS